MVTGGRICLGRRQLCSYRGRGARGDRVRADPLSDRRSNALPTAANEPATIQLSGGKAALIGEGNARPSPAVKSLNVPTRAAAAPGRIARLLADAEGIAQSITDGYPKTVALADVAGALVAIDPHRADRLISEAERAARSVHDKINKAEALGGIARALAVTDPDRAERIARSRQLFGGERMVSALISIAAALAVTDPDRAERIARSLGSDLSKARSLARVAGALVAIDQDRAARLISDAMRIAQSLYH
jgi:hypothetical protein